MKKLLAGLFIFGALTFGAGQVHASALSDALLKIQSLTQELTQLRSSLKASVTDPNLPSITNIITTPSWASLDISFKTSSPVAVTEVGYCLKKGSDSSSCVRNVVRGLSSYSDVRFSVASIEPTTNYTYYLYAKNSYGEERSADINFTSLVVPFEAYDNTPQVYLSPRVEIYPAPPGLTSNTADVGGHVTSWGTTGVSEKGACYGSSSSSVANCKTAYLVQGPGDMFATKFTGLTPDTTYYYRVYAKNSTETVYSAVSIFKTIAGASDLTPINGGWTSWTNFGSCTNNLQNQTRTCTNPAPSNGGTTCGGVSTQQISCSSPVNGGWTLWTNTGGCVNNLQIQTRTCTNPSPANGGTICSGNLAQQISCGSSTLPNLWASKVDGMPVSASPTYTLGTSKTFTGTITNSGGASTSGSFYSHFELKNNLSSSTSVINLSAVISGVVPANGGTVQVSSGLNLTAAGNYSIRICADQYSSINNSGAINESDESDNCGYWTSFIVSESNIMTPSVAVTSSNEITTVSDTTEKGVLRFNIKAENSNVDINSFKIIFENKNKEISSPRLSDYITEVNTYWEGIQIGTLKVSDFTMIGSGIYSKTLPIALGVSPILNNQSKDYYIKVKMNPSFSADNTNNNWKISATSVRYTDSTGVVSVSDASAVNTFYVKSSSSLAPSIKVLSPIGGESYKIGDKITIKWETKNIPTDVKNISIDMPFSYISSNGAISANGGICSWSSRGDAYKTMNDGIETVTLTEDCITHDNGEKSILPTSARIEVSYADSLDDSIWTRAYSNYFAINSSSVICPANVPSVSCPEYQTEAVKDANGCIIAFRCKNSTGCANGEIYNSMTGALCYVQTETNSGCSYGQVYNTMTGELCLATSPATSDSNLTPINRTLRRGTTGDDVKRLQEFLNIYADGVFGRGTEAKVKEWQIKNGLYSDGLFGRGSRSKAGLE